MKKILKPGALVSIPCYHKVWCPQEEKDIFKSVTRVYGMILKDYTDYSSHTADVRAGLFEVMFVPEFKIFTRGGHGFDTPFFWGDLFATTNSKLKTHRRFKILFEEANNKSWNSLNNRVFKRALLLGKFLEIE